jgi:hypothetical protein
MIARFFPKWPLLCDPLQQGQALVARQLLDCLPHDQAGCYLTFRYGPVAVQCPPEAADKDANRHQVLKCVCERCDVMELPMDGEVVD